MYVDIYYMCHIDAYKFISVDTRCNIVAVELRGKHLWASEKGMLHKYSLHALWM